MRFRPDTECHEETNGNLRNGFSSDAFFQKKKISDFFEVNFRLRLYLWDALRLEICLLLALTRYEC